MTNDAPVPGPAPGRRTTITDIARRAEVSVSTVSKVLNGHTDISAQTRAYIQRLLDDAGYQRPRAARRHGRGDLIDIVFNELDSAWGLALLTGVEDVAEAANIGVTVSAVHNRASLTRRWLDSLLARDSQGAILVLSELTEEQQRTLARRNVPVVVVDGLSQPPPQVPSIGATNFAGGYAAAEHLINLGHRRIAAIGGPEQVPCTRARIAGWRAALEAAGLPVPRDLVRYGNFHHDGGLRNTLALLHSKNPPTAIFAGCDEQATGAYEAIRQRGLSVPSDISVVGFDDLPFARFTAPPLTTVRQPLHEMGALAARTLLRLISGDRLDSTRIELATTLEIRESTAAPRH